MGNSTADAWFELTVNATSGDVTYTVYDWTGTESVHGCYDFKLTIASSDPDLDTSESLYQTATFKMFHDCIWTITDVETYWAGLGVDDVSALETERTIHGMVMSMSIVGTWSGYYLYEIELRPRAYGLSLQRGFATYCDQSVPEIIESVLTDYGFADGTDYEFRMQSWQGDTSGDVDSTYSFPLQDFCCQFGESGLDFIQRLMERWGLYYYFEQGDSSELMVITNQSMAHAATDLATVAYVDEENATGYPAITLLNCKASQAAATATLMRYDYETPDTVFSSSAEVDTGGSAEQAWCDDLFANSDDGDYLATLRGEMLAWQGEVFSGSGQASFLAAGALTTVADHWRSPFNQEYLFLEIKHEGSQPLAGVALNGSTESSYANSFTAITATTQYRPTLDTARPTVGGPISAFIDLDGVDSVGRYKVRFPFERVGDGDGGASGYVRLAKPYQGGTFGLHFPLRQGAEVLVSFEDGDPSRPIITGVVENSLTPSQTDDVEIGRLTLATGSVMEFQTTDDLTTTYPDLAASSSSSVSTEGSRAMVGSAGLAVDGTDAANVAREKPAALFPIDEEEECRRFELPVAVPPVAEFLLGPTAQVFGKPDATPAHPSDTGTPAAGTPAAGMPAVDEALAAEVAGYFASNSGEDVALATQTDHTDGYSSFATTITPYEIDQAAVARAYVHTDTVLTQNWSDVIIENQSNVTEETTGEVHQYIEGDINRQHVGDLTFDQTGKFDKTVTATGETVTTTIAADTYTYTLTGDEDRTINGDSTWYVTGNFTGTVNGDYDLTVKGDYDLTVKGDSSLEKEGTYASYSWGAVSETYAGVVNKNYLINYTQSVTGLKIEVIVGGSLKTYLGGGELKIILGIGEYKCGYTCIGSGSYTSYRAKVKAAGEAITHAGAQVKAFAGACANSFAAAVAESYAAYAHSSTAAAYSGFYFYT